MLKRKNKGIFLELNENAVLAAVTDSLSTPTVIEKLAIYPMDLPESELKQKISSLAESARGPVRSRCAVYPGARFCHRAVLDTPHKVKDPKYLGEFLKTQFQIDAASHAIAVLSAATGREVDAEKGPQKEVVFCGAPLESVQAAQDKLLSIGVFPETMEIGTVVNIGGLCRYGKAMHRDAPILLLEVAEDSAQIMIVQEGRLEFSRPIAAGIAQMIPQIQSRLGLKDEASARKLFQASAFDFTEIGPTLLRQTLKELQASIGYYEVHTGQSVSEFCLTMAPPHLQWIGNVVAESLGLEPLRLDFRSWLEMHDLTWAEGVKAEEMDMRWLGVAGLLARSEAKAPVEEEEEHVASES